MKSRLPFHPAFLASFSVLFLHSTAAADGWGSARIKTTTLESNVVKTSTTFAWSLTDHGTHVAKVEFGDKSASQIRLDGKIVGAYDYIGMPMFSTDGSTLAFSARQDLEEFHVIAGKEGPKFDELLPDTFVLSQDGQHHAYLAKRGGGLVAVIDGVVQSQDDGVPPWKSAPVISPDGHQIAYVSANPSSPPMRTILNGRRGEPFDAIDVRYLTFSPDSKHFVYAAQSGDQWSYVLDAKRLKSVDGMGIDFVFSPDGRRTAYIGRIGADRFLVLDGKEEPIEGSVDHTLVFSPDSRHFAIGIAKKNGSCHMLLDGKAQDIYQEVGAGPMDRRAKGSPSSCVLFSPDSRRLAYAAKKDGEFLVVVDGKPQGPKMQYLLGGYSSSASTAEAAFRIQPRDLLFSPDSKRLAYGGQDKHGKYFAVIDGIQGPSYDRIILGNFSPDSRHFVYGAQQGGRAIIVVDGVERAAYTTATPAPGYFRQDGVLEIVTMQDRDLVRLEITDLP